MNTSRTNMIVSGFTQRNSNGPTFEAILPGQHIHCSKCYLVNCTKFVGNASACAMINCELCGWRCHECKLTEHTLSCPEERVVCLNKEYGCPHVLKRSKMAVHLVVCPASVVFCAEEWSRWPMHAKEQGVRMPLPQEKSFLECGQLDVGLAMRDQRMLIDSLRAPRTLRHTLRNSLTQKYPAAPFPHWRTSSDSDPAASDATSQTVSDDDADAPWDLSKSHPGLKESIRSRLYRVTKETADSLAAALEMTTSVLSSSQSWSSDGGERIVIDEKVETASLDTDSLQTKPLRHLSPVESSEFTNKFLSSPVQFHSAESAVNKTIEMGIDGANAEGNIRQSGIVEGASPFVDRLARSSTSSDRCSDVSTRLKSTLHDIGGTQLHKLIGFQPNEGLENEICLHKMLGVNINIECINKYVIKPSSMYTFICAQNFRRDEYPWHFKNIHLEIHTGFCGWLEQRCPLANLGCTFSFHRMEPAQQNTVIYHSWLQESFGVRNSAQPISNSCNSSAATDSIKGLNPVVEMSPEFELNHTPQGNTAQQRDHYPNKSSNSDVYAVASISNLAKCDRELDIQASKIQQKCCDEIDNSENLSSQNFDIFQRDASANNSVKLDIQQNHSHSQERDIKCKTINFMRVQPTIYTASNWDSKVLFQYDLEAEGEDEVAGITDFYHNLADLPFEILRNIARHLDSFSLCNLSLTCHLLRDVCCSLLDDHGIVLLNWQKQTSKSSGKVNWKVASQRWMFSTSFEPIRSWRFTSSHPTIGDHLKVCPFNKDIMRHTAPIRVLMPCSASFV